MGFKYGVKGWRSDRWWERRRRLWWGYVQKDQEENEQEEVEGVVCRQRDSVDSQLEEWSRFLLPSNDTAIV